MNQQENALQNSSRAYRLVDLGNLGREIRDLLRELRDRGAELVDLGVERLDGRRLLLARLLVRAQLRVAPALVLGLLVGLLHEADDKVLTGTPLATLELTTASTIHRQQQNVQLAVTPVKICETSP